ncbi:MAG: Coenzyme F420 hydrogenase/dehydrogenase, beta subunit C-terminal domain [Rikenellaceae bacterium]
MIDRKPNISYTLRHNLCTGCGVCEGACPTTAISFVARNGEFRPQINEALCNNDKGCHRCYDVCPGVGVNLVAIANEKFNDAEATTDYMAGRYLKCFSGCSNDYDIRYHSASGGMITQFLIFLLEKGYIDGAVVTKFDPQKELLVNSFIARTKQDILDAKSSKYSPVTLNTAASDIKATEGKYIIVGLPCHIQGFRKLEAIDKKFRERIAGYFTIYCSSGRSFYLTEHVFKERNIDKTKLSYFAYRDDGCLGSMVVKGKVKGEDCTYKERFQSYYHPLRSFFIPYRCLFCYDHYGELGDISFGDIHVDPYIDDKVGVNSLIVRNRVHLDWLLEAKKEGAITLDEISVDVVNSSQDMAYKKKGSHTTFIKLCKMFGMTMPVYDREHKDSNKLKSVIAFVHTRMQQYIGKHKKMWFLIDYLKGKSPER